MSLWTNLQCPKLGIICKYVEIREIDKRLGIEIPNPYLNLVNKACNKNFILNVL